MNREIVVLGFPKCGTSALARELGKKADVEVLTAPNGSLEYTWPLFREQPEQSDPHTVRAHKYTAYIYNDAALRFLAKTLPNSIFVVCVRQSEKSLISWHRMHQDIAVSGRNKEHFAYKERDFYATCSVSQYYEHFAKNRLRYDEYVRNLTAIVPSKNVVVVSQERLSQSLSGIANVLVDLASGRAVDADAKMEKESIHVSYAEKSPQSIPAEIIAELRDVDKRLQNLILQTDFLKFT